MAREASEQVIAITAAQQRVRFAPQQDQQPVTGVALPDEHLARCKLAFFCLSEQLLQRERGQIRQRRTAAERVVRERSGVGHGMFGPLGTAWITAAGIGSVASRPILSKSN